MVAISKIVIGGTKRGRGMAGLWLGAAVAMVMAGAGLAEETGGSESSLGAVMATPARLSTPAVPVAAEAAGAQDAVIEDARPHASAEEQRRMFMLLLLNSAGPLRPYNGLSR
jgi:hypothetical protein